ncbi:hypothetical protein ACN38_g7195 [Penicillium nordicum]|uniref:Uncharacterized protein n=1 Tax=Penicillium nordicum TaxID=229535 RepID=A0A0M8NZA9_9EURO|nr:hypothetical protein ACN38_g7195 [Penicillium nordicum]
MLKLFKLGMIRFTVTKWKLLFLPTYYLHDNKQTLVSNRVYTYMYVSMMTMKMTSTFLSITRIMEGVLLGVGIGLTSQIGQRQLVS